MDLDEPTPLELTRAEALVLFDWLHNLEAEGRTICENKAEQIALSHLSCYLERILVEPFQDDYSELVDKAQQRLLNGK